MITNDLKISLSKYLPPNCIDEIVLLLSENNVSLKLSRPRKTIQGSFLISKIEKSPIITINNNLNKYQFLLTFLHEWAHFLCYEQKIKGHGVVWKQTFGNLINEYIQKEAFPKDLIPALLHFSKHIKYTEYTDIELCKALSKYDDDKIKLQNCEFLSNIPENSVFLHNGILMEKLHRLRKYIVCKNMNNNKLYKCHPMMMIKVVNNNKTMNQ